MLLEGGSPPFAELWLTEMTPLKGTRQLPVTELTHELLSREFFWSIWILHRRSR